jgi:uncharacterized phage-associated protein
MNTIQQIAQWFLGKESMTHKKLQKLCYYSQAWHLALHGSELFAERFEAWVHGPVSPVLYSIYADYGWEKIPSETSQPILEEASEGILQAVWNTYASFDGDQLEALTHSEAPWQKARGNLQPCDTCTREIKHQDMRDYYLQKFKESQNE